MPDLELQTFKIHITMKKEQNLDNAETQALNIPVVSTSICQHCGKQEGDYCINPYIEDVNGREEWEYICSDCYRELVADI